MTNPDYRAELQRLVEAYDEHGGRWPDHHAQALFQAVEDARAALAQPEPVGARGEELLSTYCDARRTFYFEHAAGDSDQEDRKAAAIWGLRAVLARWGTPANTTSQEDYE